MSHLEQAHKQSDSTNVSDAGVAKVDSSKLFDGGNLKTDNATQMQKNEDTVQKAGLPSSDSLLQGFGEKSASQAGQAAASDASGKDANNSSAYKEGSITKIPSDLPNNSGGQKGDSGYHNPIANIKAGMQHFLHGVVQNRTGRF